MYNPYEVLLLLRLRHWTGMSNPVVDHPLLATPLDKLPPETPEYTDDLLERVLPMAEAGCVEP